MLREIQKGFLTYPKLFVVILLMILTCMEEVERNSPKILDISEVFVSVI